MATMEAYFNKDWDGGAPLTGQAQWDDFLNWAGTLPVRGYKRVRELAGQSWTADLDGLEKELTKCRIKAKETPRVLGVVEALLEFLQTRQEDTYRLVVWDGCNEVFEDEDDEEEDEDE